MEKSSSSSSSSSIHQHQPLIPYHASENTQQRIDHGAYQKLSSIRTPEMYAILTLTAENILHRRQLPPTDTTMLQIQQELYQRMINKASLQKHVGKPLLKGVPTTYQDVMNLTSLLRQTYHHVQTHHSSLATRMFAFYLFMEQHHRPRYSTNIEERKHQIVIPDIPTGKLVTSQTFFEILYLFVDFYSSGYGWYIEVSPYGGLGMFTSYGGKAFIGTKGITLAYSILGMVIRCPTSSSSSVEDVIRKDVSIITIKGQTHYLVGPIRFINDACDQCSIATFGEANIVTLRKSIPPRLSFSSSTPTPPCIIPSSDDVIYGRQEDFEDPEGSHYHIMEPGILSVIYDEENSTRKHSKIMTIPTKPIQETSAVGAKSKMKMSFSCPYQLRTMIYLHIETDEEVETIQQLQPREEIFVSYISHSHTETHEMNTDVISQTQHAQQPPNHMYKSWEYPCPGRHCSKYFSTHEFYKQLDIYKQSQSSQKLSSSSSTRRRRRKRSQPSSSISQSPRKSRRIMVSSSLPPSSSSSSLIPPEDIETESEDNDDHGPTRSCH